MMGWNELDYFGSRFGDQWWVFMNTIINVRLP
jgi:hypothetical protein